VTGQGIARLFVAGILPRPMPMVQFAGPIALRVWPNPALIPAFPAIVNYPRNTTGQPHLGVTPR